MSYLTFELFLTILTQCCPQNPAALWEQFHKQICEKFFIKRKLRIGTASEQEISECTEQGLQEIKRNLAILTPEKSNKFYGIPEPLNYEFAGVPKIILQEQNYDVDEEEEFADTNREKMTEGEHGQRKVTIVCQLQSLYTYLLFEVYDTLLERIYNPHRTCGYMAFIDAPGGTGKTFVLNSLLSKVRSRGDIALASAYSGVASLLLKGGCTVHKRFNVKPSMPKRQMFTIKRGTALCKLMKMAKVIVIDEAPMMDKHILEKIDSSLREIMDNNQLFGGLAVILAGDFRQILPVVKHIRPKQILNYTLKASTQWSQVEEFKLTENMRVKTKKWRPQICSI